MLNTTSSFIANVVALAANVFAIILMTKGNSGRRAGSRFVLNATL